LKVGALRLDSGDLTALARETRRLLDAAGLQEVQIFASSSLDEYEIEALVASGAPIDAFGVGTGMGVSSDAPSIDIVYKLVEYAGQGRTKFSKQKPILPGRKQVFRREQNGGAVGDVIARADETLDGRPLLRQVLRAGQRIRATDDDLQAARDRAAEEISRLPRHVTRLPPADPPYPVDISSSLEALHESVRGAFASRSESAR
jgi:nicotinate phosphoribosyltransferase